MVTIHKPKSITITIRDRQNNKSRSITIYDSSLDKIFGKIKNAVKNNRW